MVCDIEMAAFNLAHDYGIKRAAFEMDVSANVLNKQVDPHVDTHRLSLATASKLQRLSQNPAILKAMAADIGYMVAKRPDVKPNGDGLLDNVLALSKKLGEVSDKLGEINADRSIDKQEAAEFEHVILELISMAMSFSLEVHDLAVGDE